MYYVNKIVGWILSPVGVLFLGLAMGALLCIRRTGGTVAKLGRWIVVLAAVQAWLFGCGVTTRLIGVPLEGRESDVAVESLPSADAVVLLGGGMGMHGKCGRAEIYGGADRVWMAAKVFKAGKAPFMTVSGGGARGEIAFLSDMGVGRDRIVSIDKARNTEEEARLIAEAIARRRQTGSARPKILLVTSAWHMPRAKMLFERSGFDIVPVPTDYEMNAAAESPLAVGDFFPNADALLRNSCAVKEWVARALYAIKR